MAALGIVLFLPWIIPAAWAAPATDPVATRLNACLATPAATTTAGMVACTGDALTAYDHAIEALYRRTLGRLDPVSAKLLRTSQQRWRAYRAAELAAAHGPWSADAGTILPLEVLSLAVSADRQRLAELRLYRSGD